ncbi:MAG: MFS transporter, partial [Candidatus Thermoplasmatota archaeon]
MKPERTRWAYLSLSFVMNVMLGTAYSWSVFDKPLREAYGADPFTAMLPMATALVMFSVGRAFCGGFVDRHGPRKVALLGGI